MSETCSTSVISGGKSTRSVTLSQQVFGNTGNSGSIYYAILAENANRRLGTASSKGRSDVRGSNRKPWRQKGTGNARAGTRKSPLWRSGGVVFGPHNRDYTIPIPKKQKQSAVRALLSYHLKQQSLCVAEQIDIVNGKTKELVKFFNDYLAIDTSTGTTLLIVDDSDANTHLIRRSARNIPGLLVNAYNRLTANGLMKASRVVMSESTIKLLDNQYSTTEASSPSATNHSIQSEGESQ